MSLIRQVASRKIQNIADYIDLICTNEKSCSFEIDYQEGEILLTDSLKRQFLLNYHGVTNQLWYSSPLSGAHHFAFVNGEWLCTRTGNPLNDLLSNEWSRVCQVPIQIQDNEVNLEDHSEDFPTDA